jgi:lysine 2,3-aminomutase
VAPQKGIELIRGLRGFTTGYAVPQFVIDAPDGGGKVPINPDYIESMNAEGVVLRNYLGNRYEYPSPPVSCPHISPA